MTVEPPETGAPLTKQDFEALARFRFGIRRYLRFSEETVRRHGVTPQQYQLMLALKGFPNRDWAVVRELADRLQLRHHSVVELVSRAQREGFVERTTDPDDARAVRVALTDEGERLLSRLSALHRDELRRMNSILAPPHGRPDDDHELPTEQGMTDTPANGAVMGTGDAIEVVAQGEHEYVVRLSSGADVVESWFRLTPDLLDRLGTSEVDEEGLVRRTVAFLLHYQDAADFPAVVELEDVLAAYDGYASAMTS